MGIKRALKSRCLFIAAGSLAVVAIVGSMSAGTLIAVSDEADIQVNSAGQTYGVPEGTDGEHITMPDLVRVEATNGKMGYVNYAEMNEIASDYILPDGRNVVAVAFQDALNEYYGVEVAGEAEGLQGYSIAAYRDPSLESDEVELGRLVSKPLVEAMRSGSLSREKTVEIVCDSLAAGTLSDKAKAFLDKGDSGLALFAEKGISSQSREIAGISGMVDNTFLASIEAGDITMGKQAYDSIYLLAKEKMSVSIPVYDENGTTVIGEYILDRI